MPATSACCLADIGSQLDGISFGLNVKARSPHCLTRADIYSKALNFAPFLSKLRLDGLNTSIGLAVFINVDAIAKSNPTCL